MAGDPLGFFTPFLRRFLGGSELLPFFRRKNGIEYLCRSYAKA